MERRSGPTGHLAASDRWNSACGRSECPVEQVRIRFVIAHSQGNGYTTHSRLLQGRIELTPYERQEV
jgi:hypothetical protein